MRASPCRLPADLKAAVTLALALSLSLVGVPALAQDMLGGALPSLGDAGEMTTLDERKLGDLIIAELYRDPDYIDDPVVGEYVDGIWRQLQEAARARGELSPELQERFAWEVLLGRDRTINAFALPGGYFGLHLGLVGAVSTRDELASVLAHEMSHITQRHIARLLGQRERQTPLLLAAMVLGAMAASKNPQAGAALAIGGQAAVIQQQLDFSRNMEREADRIGYGVMVQAGFAPQGFVSMFQKLQAASRIDDNGDWPYLRSHPLTSQRIGDMQQRQQSLPLNTGQSPDLEALLVAARARVLAGPGVDVLRAWATEPEQPGFERRPLDYRAGALYAAALAQARLRNLTQAEALATQLAQSVMLDDRAMHTVRLLQAELALATGQAQRALALLPPMPQHGGQDGRAVLLLRAQAFIQAGQAHEAVPLLRPWLSEHPDDSGAWQLLAQAEDADGQTLAALRAEGEVQMARRDYAGAIDRWRAAQEHAQRHAGGAADLIEVSIIDIRLRAAQEARKQQQADELKFKLN